MITRCLRSILLLLFLTVWQVAFAQNICSTFTYDAAGRVISQTLPDNRVIGFEYYADGELKSITPPNSQRHVFSYTSKNDTDGYQPPPIAGQSGDTVYRYNKDRQLTQIALPGGAQVNYVYDAIKGRLNQVTAGVILPFLGVILSRS